jgi:hypothetical protein
MILYDDNISLTDNTTITHSRVEFIIALFNNHKDDVWYVIVEYKPSKMQLSHFNSMLETFIHSNYDNWRF